jgi:hypothetical protein
MAFDMYLGKERESINHQEEGLFEIIFDDESYPKLNTVWEDYYNGPLIQPNKANDLVHELVALRIQIVGNDKLKYLIRIIDRLVPFLSKAYRTDKEIRCVSD